jgi:hypothetical protein
MMTRLCRSCVVSSVISPRGALINSAAQVPGLSAPIPPGAQFGFQPGGWGKPPVDEAGNPLYGDVFGQAVLDGDDDVRARAPASCVLEGLCGSSISACRPSLP